MEIRDLCTATINGRWPKRNIQVDVNGSGMVEDLISSAAQELMTKVLVSVSSKTKNETPAEMSPRGPERLKNPNLPQGPREILGLRRASIDPKSHARKNTDRNTLVVFSAISRWPLRLGWRPFLQEIVPLHLSILVQEQVVEVDARDFAVFRRGFDGFHEVRTVSRRN